MKQPKYRIEIFWSDEDGGYIANVPDLRYCLAFGESYEEALHEVLVAMELHLDALNEMGRPIPEAQSWRVVGALADDPGSGGQVVEETGAAAGQAAEQATATAGQVADETAASSWEVVEQKRLLREALPKSEIVTGQAPIGGYDELNVAEVSRRLASLSAEELRKVREYEKRNKNRETLLAQVERRIEAS